MAGLPHQLARKARWQGEGFRMASQRNGQPVAAHGLEETSRVPDLQGANGARTLGIYQPVQEWRNRGLEATNPARPAAERRGLKGSSPIEWFWRRFSSRGGRLECSSLAFLPQQPT